MSIEDDAGLDPMTAAMATVHKADEEEAEEPPPSPAPEKAQKVPPLSIAEMRKMFAAFYGEGFDVLSEPSKKTAPVIVSTDYEGLVRKYKLWVFRIKTGGGDGPLKGMRKESERRIQVSSGPKHADDFSDPDFTTLLLGYNVEEDEIVVFDRKWLEHYTTQFFKYEIKGSSSAQIDVAHFGAEDEASIRKVTKDAALGFMTSWVMKPAQLPGFLANVSHDGTYREAPPVTMPLKDEGIDVETYCRRKGYVFEPDLIARYIASMLAKPFVIFTGISGTGKSKLAELVAEFYSLPSRMLPSPREDAGAAIPTATGFGFFSRQDTSGYGRVTLVPVRPDWIDNKSILGFMNPVTGGYESTLALDIILRALARPDERRFMILDEMNLAKVEHYFSDWLACTESRRPGPNGTVTQQAVPLHRAPGTVTAALQNAYGADDEAAVPRTLALPVNLIVTGTVNVDETTNAFSPKVLDRAMVIEFDAVDLGSLRTVAAGAEAHGYRFPPALPPFALPRTADYAALPEATHRHIEAINKILEEARLHVGYRAATEMALFIRRYDDILPEVSSDPDLLRALDVAVLQKVLPRIIGNRARLERPLARLCGYLHDLSAPTEPPDRSAFRAGVPGRMDKSYRRVLEMWDTLNAFGFTSFFK